MKQALINIFERDLEKLKEEILQYKNVNNLWVVEKEISNSAGNLCLHLIGNLHHFIGAILGETGYIRKREEEFVSKGIPLYDLIKQIDQTKAVVHQTLSALEENDLLGNFPIEKHGQVVTMQFMLLHLLTHFNYHLGQINYHRRLIDVENQNVAVIKVDQTDAVKKEVVPNKFIVIQVCNILFKYLGKDKRRKSNKKKLL